jgi:hypothetical protein
MPIVAEKIVCMKFSLLPFAIIVLGCILNIVGAYMRGSEQIKYVVKNMKGYDEIPEKITEEANTNPKLLRMKKIGWLLGIAGFILFIGGIAMIFLFPK